MMPVQQADKIEKTVIIRAPRSKVWNALTKMEHFSKWFRVKSPEEFRPNARVNLTSVYPGHEGIEMAVDVVDMEPERRFSWRWFPGGQSGPSGADDQPTLVVFELEEVEGGTKVTVTESGFNNVSAARRAKAFESNTKGWEMQVENIRNYVEQQA